MATPDPYYTVGLDVVATVDLLGPGTSTLGLAIGNSSFALVCLQANFAEGDLVLYHGNMLEKHGGLAEFACTKVCRFLWSCCNHKYLTVVWYSACF